MGDFSASSQLNAFNLGSPQDNLQPTPNRIVQAATIAPTTKLIFTSGATQIATITPPIEGYHELVIIPASASTLLTSGNIANAVVLTQDLPNRLYYDPVTKKYYGDAGNIT